MAKLNSRQRRKARERKSGFATHGLPLAARQSKWHKELREDGFEVHVREFSPDYTVELRVNLADQSEEWTFGGQLKEDYAKAVPLIDRHTRTRGGETVVTGYSTVEDAKRNAARGFARWLRGRPPVTLP